ncbi:hypothetical protein [Klebsiella pneumoniae]|uniref:hypothetical protein n=1 Tax=Klebsiella pneumoniae TaxID=573 RepID=UPI0010BEBF12|nr:hypothetical protein [Klebsiella pneumoniae]
MRDLILQLSKSSIYSTKPLSDYLQQQRDREEALKRKLSQLKPTVRNGEAGEIIAALIDLGSVGGDFKKTTYDYIYEYFASARCIDVLVVMLFLNMKHPLSDGAIKKAYARQSDSEDSRSAYISLIVDTIDKRR